MSTAAALPRVEGQHQNHALAAVRRARAVELVTQGMTYQQVADELGYANRGTVYRIVHQALSRETSEAVETHKELEVARLNTLQASIWDQAMNGDLDAARSDAHHHRPVSAARSRRRRDDRRANRAPHRRGSSGPLTFRFVRSSSSRGEGQHIGTRRALAPDAAATRPPCAVQRG